jgi:hypothetical protein
LVSDSGLCLPYPGKQDQVALCLMLRTQPRALDRLCHLLDQMFFSLNQFFIREMSWPLWICGYSSNTNLDCTFASSFFGISGFLLRLCIFLDSLHMLGKYFSVEVYPQAIIFLILSFYIYSHVYTLFGPPAPLAPIIFN